jgi:hypothetical protein
MSSLSTAFVGADFSSVAVDESAVSSPGLAIQANSYIAQAEYFGLKTERH